MVGAIQVLRIAGSRRLELKGEKKAPKVFEQGKDMDKTALQGTAQQCCGGWITRRPCQHMLTPPEGCGKATGVTHSGSGLLSWLWSSPPAPSLDPGTELCCYILLIRQAKEGEMTTLDD